MENRDRKSGGRFLRQSDRQAIERQRRVRRIRRFRRWVTVTVLLLWDGVLLYLIVHCLIAPAWGGAFVALVSVNLGYELKKGGTEYA